MSALGSKMYSWHKANKTNIFFGDLGRSILIWVTCPPQVNVFATKPGVWPIDLTWQCTISSCWSNEAEIIRWWLLSHIVVIKPSGGHDPYCRPLQLIVKCTNECVTRLRLRLIFLTLWRWSTSETYSTDRVINTEPWLYWLYGGCLLSRCFLMSELESDKGLYVVWLPGSIFAPSLFPKMCGTSQQGCLAQPNLCTDICVSFTASVCPCDSLPSLKFS